MSKFEVVCPYCKKPSAVEKDASAVLADGLSSVQCSHCLKRWGANLSEMARLEKSAPAASGELAALRVQVRAQMDELMGKINGLIERRAAGAATTSARFNVNGGQVEKSDEINRELLNKALANGKPFTGEPVESSSLRFQTVDSVGSGQRVRSGAAFDINGIEKSDAADQELRRALGNGKPVGFSPRGN